MRFSDFPELLNYVDMYLYIELLILFVNFIYIIQFYIILKLKKSQLTFENKSIYLFL